MKNNSEHSSSKGDAKAILEAINTVEEHIRERYFSPLKMPQWELMENDFKYKLSKFLHKAFSPAKFFKEFQEEIDIMPSGLIVYFLSFISFIFQPYTPFIWLLIWFSAKDSQLQLSLNVVLWLISFFAFTIIVIYISIGAYWRFYEIVISNYLKRYSGLIYGTRA